MLELMAGIGVGVAAIAVLILSLAVLLRAFAKLFPPMGEFLNDVQQMREWRERKVEQQRRGRREPRPEAGAETAETMDGVAPAPVDLSPPARDGRARAAEGPTSASIPAMPVGDLDRFEDLRVFEEPPASRPVAPGSKVAAKPPGEPLQSEQP